MPVPFSGHRPTHTPEPHVPHGPPTSSQMKPGIVVVVVVVVVDSVGEGTHAQTPPPCISPHTWPLGHSPPQAGASEVRHVGTHWQKHPKAVQCIPQRSPAGHVPSHAGGDAPPQGGRVSV